MERLTSKKDWIEAGKDLSHEYGYSHIWRRLKQIEDILSDDYDLDRLRELVEADKYGRCVMLPNRDHTNEDGENALKSAMNTCYYHNNPVTRYIADAVAEKLTREATLEKEKQDVQKEFSQD